MSNMHARSTDTERILLLCRIKLHQAQELIDSAFLTLGTLNVTNDNSIATEELYALTRAMLKLSQASQLISESRAISNSEVIRRN